MVTLGAIAVVDLAAQRDISFYATQNIFARILYVYNITTKTNQKYEP